MKKLAKAKMKAEVVKEVPWTGMASLHSRSQLIIIASNSYKCCYVAGCRTSRESRARESREGSFENISYHTPLI